MSYVHANVTLTPGQIKKLQSKHAATTGVSTTLKQTQLAGGPNKLSLTKRQLNHLNKAKAASKGARFDYSAAAIKDMVKSGGIFPLLAEISALISSAAQAEEKSAALGAVGTAAGMALKKVTGKGYKKERSRSKTTRDSTFVVPKTVLKRVNIFSRETPFPLSNFDFLDAVARLRIKHFRDVFMREQLPQRPNNQETCIINLDNKNGPGTHCVAYAIGPRGIVYFDSYGLALPVEFLTYVSVFPVWQSTLPTQTPTDQPICGQQVLNVLDAISRNPKIHPHKVVYEYTTLENR